MPGFSISFSGYLLTLGKTLGSPLVRLAAKFTLVPTPANSPQPALLVVESRTGQDVPLWKV